MKSRSTWGNRMWMTFWKFEVWRFLQGNHWKESKIKHLSCMVVDLWTSKCLLLCMILTFCLCMITWRLKWMIEWGAKTDNNFQTIFWASALAKTGFQQIFYPFLLIAFVTVDNDVADLKNSFEKALHIWVLFLLSLWTLLPVIN